MSEQDVKDASAGVLKDLKRFQLEKEDDLKRYMVSWIGLMFFFLPPADVYHRLHMRSVTSIGRRKTLKLGEKLKKRLARSRRGSITERRLWEPSVDHLWYIVKGPA